MWEFKKPDTGNSVAWDFVGIFVTLVCTILGVLMKDLTMLFIPAWLSSLVPIFNFTTGISPRAGKIGIRFVIALVVAATLFGLRIHYKPKQDVPRVVPILSWFPAPIEEGRPLSSEQLNAQANDGTDTVVGTFIYSEPVGSTLSAGHPPLHVTFTPDDPIHFASTEKSVTILVTPRAAGHELSLADRTQMLASDILSNEIVRVRLARDWWEHHETYKEKFVGSDSQFDMEFAARITEIFSELDKSGMDTTTAREQFINHEVLYLGFGLESMSRALKKNAPRSLSAEDTKFLIDRFGLNAGGEHNELMKLDRDSTMLVYANPSCVECNKFAEQIRSCAEQAKWKVNQKVEPLAIENNPGVIVRGNQDGLGGEPGFWLSKMGFTVSNEFQKKIPDNPMEVHLFVDRESTTQQ